MKRGLLITLVLVVIILIAYEGLVLYDNHFPFGRMWETPVVKPLEQTLPARPDGSIPLDGEDALYRVSDPGEIRSPIKLADPRVVAQGESLYLTYCAQCHGHDFSGVGPVGQSFYPPLPDLRDPEIQSLSNGELFKNISYGIPGKRQPPLASTISVADRWRIIAFVRSLRSSE